MTTPNEHISIVVFRPLDGIRTPYKITLDRLRNVISDEVDRDALERIKANPFILARHRIDAGPDTHTALLQAQGLHRQVTDKGVLITRTPPDEWSTKFDQWLKKDQPNPFPGTDELRVSYYQELDDVEARIAAGNCPGCEIIKTQVSYRERLRTQLGTA